MSSAEDIMAAFAQLVGKAVAAELRGGVPAGEWIDQTVSPLGARLHCRAVRRRLAEGKGGASNPKAELYLLTREALNEELARSPKPGIRKCKPAPTGRDAVAEATLAKLRLIRAQKKG